MKIKCNSSKAHNRALRIEYEFNNVHDNKYDYSQSVYKGYKKHIDVVCKIHGKFSITPQRHLYGQGCPICKDVEQYGHIKVSQVNLRTHREVVLSYLKEIHQNLNFNNLKYDGKYFEFECVKHGYVKSTRIVCDKCRQESKESEKLEVIQNRVKLFLADKNFKIKKLEYNDIVLECEHGVFNYTNKEIYNNIIKCKTCLRNTGYGNPLSTDAFISRAIERRGDIYNIRNVKYVNAKTPITLICEKHGEFEILTSNFFKGQGCPKCTHIKSFAEFEISQMIPNSKQGVRNLIKPYEIDVVADVFGIEYNGLMYHSFGKSKSEKFNNHLNENVHKNKHLKKTNMMEQRGFQLFHVFENEWLDNKDIWKSIINHKIGKSTRIYARNCTVGEVDKNVSAKFNHDNNLFGDTETEIKLGLYYKNKLVFMMTFNKNVDENKLGYELIDLCPKINVVVVGGASKLLRNFERQYNPDYIVTYGNRRITIGDVYGKLGFDFVKNTKPKHFYFKPNVNVLYDGTKFNFIKNQLEFLDDSLSETDNMYNNGYRKIYDCGYKKYVKKYVKKYK